MIVNLRAWGSPEDTSDKLLNDLGWCPNFLRHPYILMLHSWGFVSAHLEVVKSPFPTGLKKSYTFTVPDLFLFYFCELQTCNILA